MSRIKIFFSCFLNCRQLVSKYLENQSDGGKETILHYHCYSVNCINTEARTAYSFNILLSNNKVLSFFFERWNTVVWHHMCPCIDVYISLLCLCQCQQASPQFPCSCATLDVPVVTGTRPGAAVAAAVAM